MNKIFVISGQSGVGKNHIVKEIINQFPKLSKIITVTSRPARPQEIDGIDYIFVTPQQFNEMIAEKQFLEYMPVHDYFYGTPKEQVEKALNENKNILLVIDVKGAQVIKDKFLDRAILIFISYPKGDLLKQIVQRFKNDKSRTNVSQKELEKRFETAKKEEQFKILYDYVVENPEGQMEKAVSEIANIINTNS